MTHDANSVERGFDEFMMVPELAKCACSHAIHHRARRSLTSPGYQATSPTKVWRTRLTARMTMPRSVRGLMARTRASSLEVSDARVRPACDRIGEHREKLCRNDDAIDTASVGFAHLTPNQVPFSFDARFDLPPGGNCAAGRIHSARIPIRRDRRAMVVRVVRGDELVDDVALRFARSPAAMLLPWPGFLCQTRRTRAGDRASRSGAVARASTPDRRRTPTDDRHDTFGPRSPQSCCRSRSSQTARTTSGARTPFAARACTRLRR